MGIGRLARAAATVSALTVLATTTGFGVLPGGTAVAAGQLAAECKAGGVIRDLPWAQRLLQPERVWTFSTGAGVTVAVLDSTVDASHPQLRDQLLPAINVVKQSSSGCVAHGTSVAGIIAAKSASGVGFRGLAPDARVLPVRVSDRGPGDSNPAASPTEVASAIRQAAARAKVLNISLVLYNDEPVIREAIAHAIKQDVVVVAAVGNGHTSEDPNATDRTPYPAAYPGVLGVGAISEGGMRLPQSQVGSYVDLVAPGVDVIAPIPVGGHDRLTGTSYAAPFVAATAALVRSARPNLSAAEVVNRLQATATPAAGGPGSRQYGAGIVNPQRAVTEILLDGEKPSALPSAPVRSIDPVVAARTATWRHTTQLALTTAVWALAVLALLLVAAAVLRHGQRRNWRPGRAPTPLEGAPAEPATPAAQEPLRGRN